MKKINIILIIAVIILSIALTIMTLIYFNMEDNAKNSLDAVLNSANELFEANKRINELEAELEKYKNANNTVSAEPYIPDGMEVADPNDTSGIKASDMEFNRSPENVTIEILEDTITNTSVEILITDNNEDDYGWGKAYRIQRKQDGKWNDVEPINDLVFESIGYILDENNQLKQKINWENLYGKLEKGVYRIVKPVYDKEYIDLYSNEFEIK